MNITTTTLRLAIAAMVCGLCTAAIAADKVPASIKLSAKDKQTLMKTLRKQLLVALKDPDSARFKDEFVSLSDDAENPVWSLCGTVNSKNAYGGYVGFSRFIVTMNGMLITDTGATPSATQYAWPVWCGKPA